MNLIGPQISQNINQNTVKISALDSKMGQIKKVMELYYCN